MKTRRIIAVIALLLFCFLGVIFIVYKPDASYSAASGTISYGTTSVNLNETKTIAIKLNNASDVQAVGGTVGVEDESCITITNIKGGAGVRVNANNFALSATEEIPNGTTLVNVTVKGLRECSTKIKLINAKLTSTDAINASANISSGTITVKKPQETTTTKAPANVPQQNISNANKPSNNSNNNSNKKETTTTKPTTTKAGSNNNYLTTLNINGYSLDFNKEVLDYSLEVEEDVDRIILTAVLEDSKASYKIEGPSELVKGKNTYNVVVEAENGSIRTYHVEVIRKGEEVKGAEEIKPEPSTYLSSIKLTNGKLLDKNGKEIKNFDKNITTYYYSKEDNFSYEYFKEYEEANTQVYETNDTITIIVSLSETDYRVYTLVKYEKNNNYIYIIVLFVLGIIIGYILKCLIKRNK